MRDRPIDTRSADLPRWLDPEPGVREPEQLVWFRADGRLPDEPLLHDCVVAYASDLTLLDTAVMAHANSWDDDRFMIASLDHAMWFHRPLKADEWLLYHQRSPSAHAGRGLAEGFIYRRDGALAVTVMQEGLIRPVKPDWQTR
jgi:acyl-CoA thioesterase-2